MKSIENYIDDLKEITGSDYESAKRMGIDRSVISNIRKRGAISDDNAIKVADALGIDSDEVLIAAAIARSEGEVKKRWENISRHLGVAASLVIACILSTSNADVAGFSNVFNSVDNIHYAKSLAIGFA